MVWGADNRFRLLNWGFFVRLRSGSVLVDQSIHCAAALKSDVSRTVGNQRRRRSARRSPVPCSVRAMAVAMMLVRRQHAAQMTSVVDQQPIGAFSPDRADPAFGDPVRPRCADRCPDHPGTERGEHLIENTGELRVTVSDEERTCSARSPRSMTRLRAC
jgi:hypothetical protein